MSDDLSLLLRQWGSRATGNRAKSQYREDTTLPVTASLPLAAAGYLATLAYPDDWEQRDKLVLAFMAYLAKGAKEIHGNMNTPAEWRQLPARDMKAWLRKAQNKIWFERVPAAQAAYELVQNRWLESDENKVNLVCEKYAKSVGRSTKKFVEREWTQSKPVFHLGYGFFANLESSEAREWPIGRFVSRPNWVSDAINTSHQMYPALVRTKIVADKELILLHAD